MTGFNPIEFAVASANEAHDQRDAYADPVGSYFDNVVDTLNEKGITGNEYHQAIEQYRETIAILFKGIHLEFGQLFDALSHNGVHEIAPTNDDDGSIVTLSHNGAYFGTIGQKVSNTNEWCITGINTHIHGTGLDSLLNTIKEIRKY